MTSKKPDPRFALAAGCQAAGQLDEADELLDLILVQSPKSAEALNLKGVVASRRGDLVQATAWVEKAAACDRRNPAYPRNLCELYRQLGRLDDGLAHGRRAVMLAPNDAGTHYHLAMLHYDRLELDQSIASARRAIALNRDHAGAHFELAEALLAAGRLEEGWREYEWRWRVADAPALIANLQIPRWNGEPVTTGTVLLIGDQGYGDTIQFARYIPMAAARCPDMVIAASPEIASLLRSIAGSVPVVSQWEQLPRAIAQAPLSSLPEIFGTTLDSIPAQIPYLSVDARACLWAERLKVLCPKDYKRVGLVWAGRPQHGNDRNRSLSLATLAPLGDLGRVSFIALQKGPAISQLGAQFWRAPLFNLGVDCADYMDTAAAIESLDLVITVDTSVAHLAGALGKPVWVLLPFAPDWRWLAGRSDSSWYPTARLFRQPAPGDWPSVISEVTQRLLFLSRGTS